MSRGEVEIDKRTVTHTCVTWRISHFYSIPQRFDTYITSPAFSFLNERCRFKVYATGQRRNNTVLFFKIDVEKEDSGTWYKVPLSNVEMSIDDTQGKFYKDTTTCLVHFGCRRYISSLELCLKYPKDSLKAYCAEKKDLDSLSVACQTDLSQTNGVYSLSQDFHTLLNSEQKSDVTIQIEDKTFQAHQVILGARSPVFAAMFKHDMREKITGVIDIEDCEPDAFKDFLEFIYTGKSLNLSKVNVTGLFSLADRYNVNNLKQICVDFMKENLCLETACSILDLADRHSEKGLKHFAREFIIKNIEKITAHQNWISFMAKNPVLCTEIFMCVVSKNDNLKCRLIDQPQ